MAAKKVKSNNGSNHGVTDVEHPITAELFETHVGRKPVDDDLERCNCSKAGRPGHLMCGWCEQCRMPRFLCGHMKISARFNAGIHA